MAELKKCGEGVIRGVVVLSDNTVVLVTGVPVRLSPSPVSGATAQAVQGETVTTMTDSEGRFEFKHVAALIDHTLQVHCSSLGPFQITPSTWTGSVDPDHPAEVKLQLTGSINFSLRKRESHESKAETLCHAVVGEPVVARLKAQVR